ncbi:MAG: hypothetical protein AAFN77_23820 [Planctomycetota bacterium]
MIFEQHPDDPNWWIDSDCLFGEFESVELIVKTAGVAPNDALVAALSGIANDSRQYVLAAAELILENYSNEHYRNLGVDESMLVDETIDDVANAAKLESVFVDDAYKKAFEMSFTVPWDPHHSFDVEFENGDAETCAVNG